MTRPYSTASSFSDLLASLDDGDPDGWIAIGEVVDRLRQRGFAAVLLLLATMEMLPVPIALWDVLGAAIAVLCFARFVRGGPVTLPGWLRRRRVSRRTLRRASSAALPWVRRIERVMRPRLAWLTGPRYERALTLAGGLLATLLTLPVPVLSWLPAIALFLLALGWFAGDGLLVIAGLIAEVLSFAAYAALVLGLIDLGRLLA